MFRFFILLIALSFSLVVPAQDTIVKLNGRMKTDVEVMRIDSIYVFYLREKDKVVNSQGRLEPRTMERVNVFEVRYENGTSELAYDYDGEDYMLHPDSMQHYINGCINAYETAHNRVIGPVSFVISAGASYAIHSINTPLLVFLVPPAISAVVAIFTPRFPYENYDEDEYMSYYYKMGYTDTKKVKKIKSATFFGYGGVATWEIINALAL